MAARYRLTVNRHGRPISRATEPPPARRARPSSSRTRGLPDSTGTSAPSGIVESMKRPRTSTRRYRTGRTGRTVEQLDQLLCVRCQIEVGFETQQERQPVDGALDRRRHHEAVEHTELTRTLPLRQDPPHRVDHVAPVAPVVTAPAVLGPVVQEHRHERAHPLRMLGDVAGQRADVRVQRFAGPNRRTGALGHVAGDVRVRLRDKSGDQLTPPGEVIRDQPGAAQPGPFRDPGERGPPVPELGRAQSLSDPCRSSIEMSCSDPVNCLFARCLIRGLRHPVSRSCPLWVGAATKGCCPDFATREAAAAWSRWFSQRRRAAGPSV